MRGDLGEVYKIMRGMDRMHCQNISPMVEESITRGHMFKVRGARFKGDVRCMIFTQRLVGSWNSLPREVVKADTMVIFKGRLFKSMNRIGKEGYGPRKGKGFLFRWATWSVQAWRAERPVPVL